MREKNLNHSTNIRRFWKKDAVLDTRNQSRYIIMQLRNETKNKPIRLVLIPITETLGVRDLEKLKAGLVKEFPVRDTPYLQHL
jgi:hypothetical protein